MITFSNLEEAVEAISSRPEFRVLKKFVPRKRYADPGPLPLYHGIYLDTETTGTEPLRDGILELAMVPFTYTIEGEVVDVGLPFVGLNDPGVEITDTIRHLTGISPDEIKGCTLDIGPEFGRAILNADVVIAHHAAFDRPFVENVHTTFRYRKWGCSQVDVPWKEKFGAIAEKLEVIAMTLCGVFYDAHRALIDCQVGIHVLATARDTNGRTALSYLLENVEQDSAKLWAIGAPYSMKDTLKGRGYRWNDGSNGLPKAWSKRLPPDQIDAENQWLREQAFCYPRVTSTPSTDKYSAREQ